MCRDISGILLRLDQHASTHPNIVTLWREYLTIKHRRFIEVMAECETVIDRLAESDDLGRGAILAIYATLGCIYGAGT